MDNRHLRLPVNFGDLMRGRELERCRAVPESISQHIHLLLTTRPGENRFDPDYGCAIWDLDFELIISEGTWKETFRASVVEALFQYEKRLDAVQVDVGLETIERVFGMRRQPEVRRKAVVMVRATMVETGEPFSFRTELYLSPLSVE